MIAAMGTLPAPHMPGLKAPMEFQPRQKQPFDARLLCAKLEAHQRELDAKRARQERAKTQRRSMFVPQTAARQFAATATPMKDESISRALHLDVPITSVPAHRPHPLATSVPASSAPISAIVNPKQLYAALSSGMSESEALAAIYHANEPWVKRETAESTRVEKGEEPRRMSPTSKETRNRSAGPEIRQSSRRNGIDSDRQKRLSYRPGDAEKRRTDVKISFNDIAFGLKVDAPGSFQDPHTILAYRQARDKAEDMPYDIGLARKSESENEAPGAVLRPKLVPHDRPNWSQESQCGDEMRQTLHLPRLSRRIRDEQSKDAEGTQRSRSECRGKPVTVEQPRRGSDNLIADAVKKIKKEDKVRRRDSVMAFFKRSK